MKTDLQWYLLYESVLASRFNKHIYFMQWFLLHEIVNAYRLNRLIDFLDNI